jgi:hypothetical protein
MRKCPPDGVNQFKPFNGNRAIYKDGVQSYSTVEPAIDLSASSMLMFAWQIAGAPAKLVPNHDIPAVVDEGIVFTPNPKWPPQRAHGQRHPPRNRAAN